MCVCVCVLHCRVLLVITRYAPTCDGHVNGVVPGIVTHILRNYNRPADGYSEHQYRRCGLPAEDLGMAPMRAAAVAATTAVVALAAVAAAAPVAATVAVAATAAVAVRWPLLLWRPLLQRRLLCSGCCVAAAHLPLKPVAGRQP